MNTKILRERYKLTQKDFASYFGIPLRTVQNWDNRDCMPEYVFNMADTILKKSYRDFFVKKHKEAFEHWDNGEPVKEWFDENGVFCIRYQNDMWWHYRLADGHIEWW